MTRYALAVDVGGTKMEAALVGDDGVLVRGSRSRRETGRDATPASLDDAIAAVIAHALSRLPDDAELVGAGIGSAGPVDRNVGHRPPVVAVHPSRRGPAHRADRGVQRRPGPHHNPLTSSTTSSMTSGDRPENTVCTSSLTSIT